MECFFLANCCFFPCCIPGVTFPPSIPTTNNMYAIQSGLLSLSIGGAMTFDFVSTSNGSAITISVPSDVFSLAPQSTYEATLTTFLLGPSNLEMQLNGETITRNFIEGFLAAPAILDSSTGPSFDSLRVVNMGPSSVTVSGSTMNIVKLS
ncbi:hypothetical protein [Pasteuria penetrans]|uniref:hypothetical protein n=1 Tax=Pasteuria penetrans TaxID=86005 RepID=UPI000FB4323A|nr:hypothetical protein [Pasteuria penetrans]